MREEGQKGTELRKEKTREMVVCERERERKGERVRETFAHTPFIYKGGK